MPYHVLKRLRAQAAKGKKKTEKAAAKGRTMVTHNQCHADVANRKVSAMKDRPYVHMEE